MSKVKEYFKENYAVLLIFTVFSVLECAVIFPLMYRGHISYDSSYQYGLTQHSIPEIIELLPYDYSPPFYALALKLYTMVFGNSLQIMRSFSIFAVIGMLFLGAFPVKKVFGKASAILCMIVTFCSGVLLRTLHEIRPTLYAMFFMMAVAIYAVIAFQSEKRSAYICFTVFSVLAMYTHNISLVGTFSVYVVLLIVCLLIKNTRKLRNFFISGGICAVLYIPWLGIILSQISAVNDHFWKSGSTVLETLRWTFQNIFLPYAGTNLSLQFFDAIFRLAMLGLLLVLFRHIKFRSVKNAKTFREIVNVSAEKSVYVNILLMALFLAVTLVILTLINLCFKNLASSRYYYILGMIWIVIFSALFGQFNYKIYNLFFSAALLAFNVLNLYSVRDALNQSDFAEIKEDISARTPEDQICFLHTHEWTLGMLGYYFPNATHYVCDETFTVLRTYDVFPMNIVDIGSIENIWDYTDNCYLLMDSDAVFNELYFTQELLEELGNNEITPVRTYALVYQIMPKESFTLAHAVYTGEPQTAS